ncbi:hypothetical protein ACS0TY_031180 [Phlomoides rotata]
MLNEGEKGVFSLPGETLLVLHLGTIQWALIYGVLLRIVYLFEFKLTNEGNGRVYFMYMSFGDSDSVRFLISWEGMERQERWSNDRKVWGVNVIQQYPVDECDRYNHCGAFG